MGDNTTCGSGVVAGAESENAAISWGPIVAANLLADYQVGSLLRCIDVIASALVPAQTDCQADLMSLFLLGMPRLSAVLCCCQCSY